MKAKRIQNLSTKEFLTLLHELPTVTIEVLIVNKAGEILLGKRNTHPFKGMWHFTGGFLYYNERVSHAVHRIAKRETGLDAKMDEFIGYYEGIKTDPRGHMISLVHTAKRTGGKLNFPNHDNYELKYFKYPPRGMIPSHKKIFEDIVRRLAANSGNQKQMTRN